jgi:type I restriction enzyme S subunit
MTSRAPVGNLAINTVPLCTNQGFKSFIVNEDIDTHYLFFYLKHIIAKIEKESHGNTFTEITKNQIEKVEILLPPTKSDQQRIASEIKEKLTTVDQMRQAALKQKEAVAALQDALLREVFLYKKGDGLPNRWQLARVGDNNYTELILGQSPNSEFYNKEGIGLPFYQGKSDFGNIHPTPTVCCSKPKKIAEPNDILLCVRAPVGPTNIAKEKCCIGRGLAAIRCLEGLDYRYLIWILRKFEKGIADKGQGSTFDAIGKEDIMKIEFPFPIDNKEQLRIANDLENRMLRIEKIKKEAKYQLKAIEALPASILREVFEFKS